MENTLGHILHEKGWILADGAIGTQLFNMGLQSGDAPELWSDLQPEKIRKLYRSSIDAGCDLFLTNSFGSNSCRLKLHNKEREDFRLSKLSAELGREEIEKEKRKIVLAGSMGPTGEILQPLGALSFKDAVEVFHIQAEGLKEGGADILWIETISHLDELRAAIDAAKLAEMEWCGTMSFDTSGRTMMGITSKEFSKNISEMDYKPLAYGANCGVGPSDLIRTLLGFEDLSLPIIAKGNAGIPKYADGKIRYDGTPELMASYACLARDAGAKIIGGCCGTTPEHLTVMRQALEDQKPMKKPSIDEIVEKLGPLSSNSDGTDLENMKGPRRLKRRRRL